MIFTVTERLCMRPASYMGTDLIILCGFAAALISTIYGAGENCNMQNSAYYARSNKCFWRSATAENQKAAVQFCDGQGVTPAVPKNKDENDFIFNNLIDGLDSETWLGAGMWLNSTKDELKWGNWEDGCCPAKSDSQCGIMDIWNGLWMKDSCRDIPRYMLCEKIDPICNMNFSAYHSPSGTCFWRSDVTMSFERGERFCAETNGTAGAPANLEMNTFVYDEIVNSQLRNVDLWIGITTAWMTLDGRSITWFDWEVGSLGQGECVVMDKYTGRWVDNSCTGYYYMICQRSEAIDTTEAAITTTTTTMSTSTTNTDLTTTFTTNAKALTTDAPQQIVGTSSSSYMCWCRNVSLVQHNRLNTILRINRRVTSRFQRTLKSQDDERNSSRYVGYVGILVIVFWLAVLPLFDILTVLERKQARPLRRD